MKRGVVALLLLLAADGLAAWAHAYDPNTHREIGRKAASTNSKLDGFLKSDLDITPGFNARFPGTAQPRLRSVIELVGDGAESEDSPPWRVLNHFHNPLVSPWEDAGLRAYLVAGVATTRGRSSVLWQQYPSQPSSFVFVLGIPLPSLGGQWSWQSARQYYLAALTGRSKEDDGDQAGRDRAFGNVFENLGHLMHVIQDATVPAHTRNDAHPPFVRPDWYEDWVEENRKGSSGTFGTLLSGTPVMPSTSIFVETSSTAAPVPIANLIDADVFSGMNADVLDDDNPTIGIAEFTSGNFLSRGTLFRTFALPRLDPAVIEESAILEIRPGQFRRYFRKKGDGIAIEHFVAESMLHRSVKAATGAPLPACSACWMLDEVIHREYAAVQLPRAVGYSNALLDYFFRGRLDVDLVDDGNGARLVGTNASAEALEGGTLQVYGDAVGAAAGLRFAASTETAVGHVESNGPLPVVALTPPADLAGAERFIAVYTGALGAERPDTGTIGAVIGKVLGGTRVEQLFSDGNRWNIRTPDGIYPLPILNDIQELVWGDADNMLVGRTAIGAAAPNQFVVYQIDRGAGDPAIPLTGSGEVRLVNANPPRMAFPVDLPIASVSVTQTIRFKQYLPAALHDIVDPDAETWAFDANLAVNEERQTTRTRDLRLDFNTFQSVSSDGHSWRIENIYGDSNGEIFALITSTLRLRNEFQTFPTKKYVDVCGGWPCPTIDGPPAFIQVTLPTSGLRSTFAALINVTKGDVRSLTAPSSGGIAQIRLSHTTSHISVGNAISALDLPSFTVREVRRQNGLDGSPTFVQFDDPTFACSDTVPHFDVGGVSVVVGTLGADVPLYRADLAAATGPSRPPVMQSSVRQLCINDFHHPLGQPFPRMTFPVDQFIFTSDRIDRALRARADGNRWTVLITKTSAGVPQRHLFRWDPDGVSASLRAIMQDSFADLISTSTRRATIATDSQMIVVALDGDANVVSSPADFASASGYIALEPSFIYRPSDGRFYRVSPTLQQTALPRPLASSAPLSGAYHTLKLK